jgi:DNA-binding NarL/FixJ family response regulator
MQILIADKRPDVRSALRLLLEQETAFSICAEATNNEELQTMLDAHAVDLLLLDWELPGCSPTFLASIVQQYPTLAVITLSSQPEALAETLHNGASAFISKSESPQYVLSVIRLIERQIQESNTVPPQG